MLPRFARFLLRLVCVFSVGLWAGGLTFYGAIALPRMEEFFGRADSALVTREVSLVLNWIGVVGLSAWWLETAMGRGGGPRWLFGVRVVGLAASTLVLVWLFPAHGRLERLVDAGSSGDRAFYAEHRDYLIAAAVQWGANLVVVSAGLAGWTGVFAGSGDAGRS
jgi:hypothetical protein